MSAAEVARAMEMPLRTYERLEASAGPTSFARVDAFARATDSDAFAIAAAEAMGSIDFALRCIDNKLVTIAAIAIRDLHEALAEDCVYLEVGTLVGAFTRITNELVAHVRKRNTYAEDWLEEGRRRVSGTMRAPRRPVGTKR